MVTNPLILHPSRNHPTNAASRIFHILLISRNDKVVEMEYGLASVFAAIHADVIPFRRVFGFDESFSLLYHCRKAFLFW